MILRSQGVSIVIITQFDGGHLVFRRWPKINSIRPLDKMKTIFFSLKSIGETVLNISRSQAYVTFNYIYFKSSMAGILISAHGAESIGGMTSNLKLSGETILMISR